MKAIKNTIDAQTVYRIEAARLSFELLSEAFDALKATLMAIEKKESHEQTHQDALNATKFALQFIDCTHRFFAVLSQIKGFKHKDDRFKKAEVYARRLVGARNFAQHLNDEIPKITAETYPILGAVSWASENQLTSRTISAGTLPPGTTFHTLAYDTTKHCYNKSVVFNIGNLQIDLSETHYSMNQVHSYLCEWLVESDLVSDQDVIPNSLVAGPMGDMPSSPTARYFRAKFVVTPS